MPRRSCRSSPFESSADELRRRVGGIHKHIREGYPRGVALPRGGRTAGLELGHDINPGHEYRYEQQDAGDKQDAGGFHEECAGSGSSRVSGARGEVSRVERVTRERLTQAAMSCSPKAPPMSHAPSPKREVTVN